MKEFLFKGIDGEYRVFDHSCGGEAIEIPDGAIRLTVGIEQRVFWDDNGLSYNIDSDYVCWKKEDEYSKYMDNFKDTVKILWERDKVEGGDSVNMSKVDETLKERQSQYGDFTSVANTTGQLMAVILNSKNGKTLPYAHEEALHMICSKIARIMNGDINHKDSWHDIGGYAKLIENLIGE